jgi:hypothetical protein
MAIAKDQIFKEIRPKIPNWLNEEDREELMEEIGDYVVTAMLDKMGDGESPVDGVGKFKNLSKDYAANEKGGDDTPNLSLMGDMWGALTYEVEFDRVKVGIFDPDEAVKAYGHNTGFKGHPWLEGKAPQRKFIPDKNESFIQEIQDGIKMIVEEFIEYAREDSEEASGA